MDKIEMIVKILQARLKAYKLDLEYTETVYGKDSLQASKARGVLCECSMTLDMLLGTEREVARYYNIWYK